METLKQAKDNTKFPFKITPPLLNSASPWATTLSDLEALYASPYTGAVTIRTSLLSGFPHNPKTHQYTFFSTSTGHATSEVNAEGRSGVVAGETSSVNTLGYSPIPFHEYLDMLRGLHSSGKLKSNKPFIVSVTGAADEVARCYTALLKLQNEAEELSLMMEINLSCPNIPSKPPPAYDSKSLAEYISAIAVGKQDFIAASPGMDVRGVHVGIKTPPYTYSDQFIGLETALEESVNLPGGCPISFITATNTLGSCLITTSDSEPMLNSANGTGMGGMAGDALHPLALGNVKTIRGMLDASSHAEIRGIQIIGVGGVRDGAGYKRMRSVGADAVAVGTALGREGVGIFKNIVGGG
ncbi:uncharacterized protein BP5553_09445 [Venustampulla echinocandica]|uniref:Dihydroorotate dehydrogenase (fumarate) n=1 Tax=Venustampulla echinocandica TaxID=2656787 RepID=A0A370TCR3_9HELO|nr:uncharacterized protein BP5553_09445 [Venustampulla echinocandica]RDL32043.1 hypothetical protein BP5553_09445 [Venustampulla echinocandica]